MGEVGRVWGWGWGRWGRVWGKKMGRRGGIGDWGGEGEKHSVRNEAGKLYGSVGGDINILLFQLLTSGVKC